MLGIGKKSKGFFLESSNVRDRKESKGFVLESSNVKERKGKKRMWEACVREESESQGRCQSRHSAICYVSNDRDELFKKFWPAVLSLI